LWQLHKNGVDRAALPALQADQLNQWLDFSNRFCGYSVQRYGAIDSYPTIDQL
jgi:fructokinase